MRKNKERRNRARWALETAVALGVGMTIADRVARAAVTTAWTSAGGGSFNAAGNWSMGVPGAADTAQFNILNSYTVTLDVNPSIASMTVGGSNVTFANSVSNRTFSISSTLNVNSGSLTLNAAVPVVFSVSNNTGFSTAVNISNGNQMSLNSLGIGSANSSVVTVSGSGSSLSSSGIGIGTGVGTNSSLTFSGGAGGSIGSVNLATSFFGASSNASLTLQGGASVTSQDINVATNAIPNATGNVTVTGANTTLTSLGNLPINVGAPSASVGKTIISSNASASFNGGITINGTGELDIQSGATVTSAKSVVLNSFASAGGTLSIGGAGSSLTINGPFSPLTVGLSSGTTSFLLLNGGNCTTSGDTTTINKSGFVSIAGGTLNVNGDLLVDGGTLQRVTSNVGFSWVSGKTMTVQNGGTVSLTGNFNPPTSATINVTGASSALTTGTCTLANSDQINITSGGAFNPANLKVTTNPSGATIGINGSGSSYSASSTLLNSGVFNYNGGAVSAGNLTLSGTGQLLMSPGHDKALVLSGLSIGGSGNLDLSDNSVIVNYASGDTTHATRQTVRNLLINGRNAPGGAPAPWNGTGGITSSFAHANGNGFNLAIGYADNEDLAAVRASGSYTSFGGQTVGSNAVLVALTRGADATLDGVVDSQDVTIIGTHFDKPGSGQWCFGDFDYSGTCDSTDVTTLGTTFGKTSPSLSPAQLTAEFGEAFTQAFEAGQSGAIPEPGSLMLLGLGGLSWMASRRCKRGRWRSGGGELAEDGGVGDLLVSS